MAVTAVSWSRVDLLVAKFTATLSAQNDTVDIPGLRARQITIQSTGTIGTAHILITASNDDTNFVALPTPVDLTAVGLHQIAAGNLGFKTYRITIGTATPGTALVFTAFMQDRG